MNRSDWKRALDVAKEANDILVQGERAAEAAKETARKRADQVIRGCVFAVSKLSSLTEDQVKVIEHYANGGAVEFTTDGGKYWQRSSMTHGSLAFDFAAPEYDYRIAKQGLEIPTVVRDALRTLGFTHVAQDSDGGVFAYNAKPRVTQHCDRWWGFPAISNVTVLRLDNPSIVRADDWSTSLITL